MSIKDDIIILSIGEVFLKKGNRHQFLSKLNANIKHILDGTGVTIERAHTRFILRGTGGKIELLEKRLQRIFGLSKAFAATEVPKDLDTISRLAIDHVTQLIGTKATRFKVETKRVDKRFPMTSEQISRELGARLLTALPSLTVDVHEPELILRVEIRKGMSFVSARSLKLAGGLPVGTAGKVLLLLSGGIDSPVAGYLTQKRGCHLEAIYFHSFPYISDHAKDKVKTLASLLARYQRKLNLHVVPFAEIQLAIKETAPSRQYVLLYRRFMIRIANRVAKRRRALALVTGESIAQVASQTLQNLRCVEALAELPIIRPLATYDKLETINLSRKLGFYDTSIIPHDDCCSLFVDKHPETRGNLELLAKIEAKLPVETLVEKAIEEIEIFSVDPSG